MDDRAARASRRAAQNASVAAPKPPPPKSPPPEEREVEELVPQALLAKYGLRSDQVWALCGEGTSLGVLGHKKNGPCRCAKIPTTCKRCCPTCLSWHKAREFRTEIPTDDIPSLATPRDRISKVRAQGFMREQVAALDAVDEFVESQDQVYAPFLASLTSLKDVSKYLGLSENDVRNHPSQDKVSTPEAAEEYFRCQESARLVNAMAKACDKVIEIGTGKSPPELVVEIQKRVAAALVKRSKRKLSFSQVTTPRASDAFNDTQPQVVTPESVATLVAEVEETEPCVLSVTSSDTDSDNAAYDFLEGFDDKHAVLERNRLVSGLVKICEAHHTHRRAPIFRGASAVLVHGVKPYNLNTIVDANGNRLFGQKARA